MPINLKYLAALDHFYGCFPEQQRADPTRPARLSRVPRRARSIYRGTPARRLGFELLESKVLLAGAQLVFDANAASPPSYTWSLDTGVTNWRNLNTGTPTAFGVGDIANFLQPGVLAVNVSGNVPVEGIVFGSGGSTTLNPAAADAVLSMFATGNNLTIEDQHVEDPSKYAVANDFINCAISPGSSSAQVVKQGTGDVQIGSVNNGLPGVTLQSGTITMSNSTFASTTVITVQAGTGSGGAAIMLTNDTQESFTVSNPIVFQTGELRIDSYGYQVTLDGAISSTTPTGLTDNLIISDTIANGTTTLAGDTSSYGGGVTIISGSLVLPFGGTLGGSSLNVAGGRFDLGGNSYRPPATFTFSSGDIADGELDLTSTTLTTSIDAGKNGFISALIGGTGGNVTAAVGTGTGSPGTLFLLSNNSYTGATTVNSGATLVYRWNSSTFGEYSIPGGPGSVAGSGTVESEYAYFQVADPNALVWNGIPGNGKSTVWQTDHGITNWDQPGPTGPISVIWTAGNDPVFEEPVPGGVTKVGNWSDITIHGTVQVADHLTFMLGSNVIMSTSADDLLVLGNTAQTLLSQLPKLTQWFFVPLGSDSGRGLKLVEDANVFFGVDNESTAQYLGTTTLVNGDTVQFVQGGLGGGIEGGVLKGAVEIDAGANGAAGISFANGNAATSLDIDIKLKSGKARIDPEGKSVTLYSLIEDGSDATPGKLLIADSVGGGTVTLNPLDINNAHISNTYTGGTIIQDGILNFSSDTDLGTAPTTAATNIEFTGNGELQWGGGTTISPLTLGATRGIVIDAGVNATFDTQGFPKCGVAGAIGGAGALTKIGSGTLTFTATTNSYAAGTTVTAGTLIVMDPGGLKDGSALNVGNFAPDTFTAPPVGNEGNQGSNQATRTGDSSDTDSGFNYTIPNGFPTLLKTRLLAGVTVLEAEANIVAPGQAYSSIVVLQAIGLDMTISMAAREANGGTWAGIQQSTVAAAIAQAVESLGKTVTANNNTFSGGFDNPTDDAAIAYYNLVLEYFATHDIA